MRPLYKQGSSVPAERVRTVKSATSTASPRVAMGAGLGVVGFLALCAGVVVGVVNVLGWTPWSALYAGGAIVLIGWLLAQMGRR